MRTVPEFPPALRAAAMLVLFLFAFCVATAVAVAQDSTLVEVMVPTDTSLVEAVPEIPTSLTDLLTQYQMPLATLLGSLIVFGLAKVTAFSNLGDWTKRAGYLLAAILVTGLVKLLGGTLSPDLAGVVSTGLSGLASAATGAMVFQLGKTQPNTQPRGG